VVKALITAHNNGRNVQVILDRVSITPTNTDPASVKAAQKYAGPFHDLQTAGVNVRESSAGFSIQHVKSMVIDEKITFVTSINLTNGAADTRDVGVILEDPKIAASVLSVFNDDWGNCLTGATTSPHMIANPNLVWSPYGSEQTLSALIASASSMPQKTVDATVENFGDPEITKALNTAAGNGCTVRLIFPEIDEGPNQNYQALAKLHGVMAKVMPSPYSAADPYMHQKMIMIGGEHLYLGSINFTTNSTTKARELGILLPRSPNTQGVFDTISASFEKDWGVAQTPPAVEPPANKKNAAPAAAALLD
jgi:phosphatidylserine/phosphatidylglycerophosphate/cardiolipin synthase-like enzyme